LNIVGDVAIPIIKETYFSTALQASSGQPFTPPLGRYEKWDAWHDAYMPNWSYYENNLVGRKNSDRLSNYFRLDIGLKQKKQFFRFPYERFIQLVNVTNHVNALTYQYRNKINRLTDEALGLERAAVPMFPFFLTFGYRIEF